MKQKINPLFTQRPGFLLNVSRFLLVVSMFLFGASVAQSKSLTIDDFESYLDDASLQLVWNSFGTAAATGPARLVPTPGSEALSAHFDLDWDSGNNANMRLATVPPAVSSLSGYDQIVVEVQLQSDWSAGVYPTEKTKMKIVVEGGSDNTIWQTSNEKAQVIPRDEVTEMVFPLSESQMVSMEGSSSLEDTLKSIKSIRLRFENKSDGTAREDVLIHQVVAQTGTSVQ
jgi:hypothetical protein